MDTLLDFFNKITKVNPTPDISFFYTIVSIVFGAITFVVSLSIIPFQKLSESISGYLYKILLKDKKLIFSIVFTTLISFTELIGLIFIKDSILIRFLYVFGLFIVFLILFIYSVIVLRKLDITESIFIALEDHFKKIIKVIEKKEIKIKKNVIYKYNELESIMKNTVLTQENPDKYPKGNVFVDCEKIFSYKCSFIYDLILRNIEKSDYASFEATINGFERCLNLYFNYLDCHYIVMDSFFIDFLEHSKIIISKCCKTNNSLFFEYYCILFEKIIDKLISTNIPQAFYQEKIIDFLFNTVYLEKKNLADCSRYIKKSYCFIKEGKTYIPVLELYKKHFEELITIIYTAGSNIDKSSLNCLINCFTYEVMSCKSNLYTDYVMDMIFELQELEDAKNLLPPMLVFDDYTTDIAIGFDKKDKTLATCTLHFLLKQEELPDIIECQQRNLYRIGLLLRIIKILEERYKKGGAYIDGIIVQLFVIYFNTILLINEKIFKYYTNGNWNYAFTQEEKDAYLNIIIQIIIITANSNNHFMPDSNLLYSELKLLTILLIDNSISNLTLKDFIWKYKKDLYNNILKNQKIDKNIKIEVYKFLFFISPRSFQKHFYNKIRKIKKDNNLGLFVFGKMFDSTQLCLQGISIFSNTDEKLKELVNNSINDFLSKIRRQ